jgi:hypothetical protein
MTLCTAVLTAMNFHEKRNHFTDFLPVDEYSHRFDKEEGREGEREQGGIKIDSSYSLLRCDRTTSFPTASMYEVSRDFGKKPESITYRLGSNYELAACS